MSSLERAAWPIWNASERRPRALVRLTIFGLLVAAVGLAVARLGWLFERTFEVWAALFGLQVLGVIVVSVVCARFVDRRPVSGLGLAPRRGYALDLAFGVVLGAICMGAIVGLELALGWGRYALRHETDEAMIAALPGLGTTLGLFVAVSLFEELTFRGYPLPNLREMMPRTMRPDVAITVAVALSSLAFGIAHGMNPNVSAIAVGHIAFGGMFLVIGLVVQGDLAIPIGAHLGWNLFQSLFGMQVSGTALDPGALWRREELGPDVVTGGAFGPEAGLEGLGAMALGIALTLGWLRLRGVPLEVHPSWRRGTIATAGETSY